MHPPTTIQFFDTSAIGPLENSTGPHSAALSQSRLEWGYFIRDRENQIHRDSQASTAPLASTPLDSTLQKVSGANTNHYTQNAIVRFDPLSIREPLSHSIQLQNLTPS